MIHKLKAISSDTAIIVRPAQPEDAAAVQAVDASATATLRKTYRPNKAALENRKNMPPRMSRVVAVCGGHVVGTVQWYVDDRCLRIVGLGVHRDFRRRGAARELLLYLGAIAKEHGAARLRLHTVKETGNVAIFTGLGFHVIAEGADDFSESDRYPALTDVEMEKLAQ